MGTQRSDGERSWGHVLDLGGRGGRCAVITALGGHQVLPFQAPGKTVVLGPQSLVLTFPFVTQAPNHVFCFTILFFSAGNEGFNPHLPGEDWRHCLEGSPVFISSLCLGKMPPDTGYTVVSVGPCHLSLLLLEDGCRNSYKSEGVLPVSAGGEVRA